jgi:phosphinothricin acetyltransferase
MNRTDSLPVLVRDACEADFPQIQAVYSYYVTRSAASFEEVPPTEEEMLRRWRDVTGRGLPYLVADNDGEVLGYAYAGPWRTRSAYRYTIENSVYVAPMTVRRGIGRAVMQGLIDRCTGLGYRQMIAVIGDSANLNSIGLHRSLGFRQEGILRGVGLKFGRWVDVVIMHRPLGPPDAPPPGTASAPETKSD